MIKGGILRILSFCIFLFFSGCSVARHADQIQTLQDLGRSQKEIDVYVREKTRKYTALKKDIVNERIDKGLSRELVIKKYGEPTFIQKTEEGGEEYTYRHPAEYFSDNSVRLYFGTKGRLVSWKK